MNLLRIDDLRQGLHSLLLHPLRSMLTILGIFIGVASVVWLLAIGEGISQSVQKQIEQLGTTNIIIRSQLPAAENGYSDNSLATYGLLRKDYDAITATVPTVRRCLRIRDVEREIHYGTETTLGQVVGCTPEYAAVMKLKPRAGHFISQAELDESDNVCVLGAGIARKLFPLESPLGRIIRVRDLPFVVVGVLEPRAAMASIGGSLGARDFSDDVYIPVTSFWRRIGDLTMVQKSGMRIIELVEVSQLVVQVETTDEVLATAEAIRALLKKSHEKEDYAIITPLELLEQARVTRMMFMALLGLIAAISLLVGGIGIMNIMLATVTERTREIGIRRALGAKRADITRQFLIETISLSAVGGLCGVLGGLACPFVVVRVREAALALFPTLATALPEAVRELAPQVVPASLPLAFGISVLVGVTFGLYPATRAAAMDPIEALRHQ